jgi:HSP20 family protein
MATKRTEIAPREERRLARRGEPLQVTNSPFGMLERVADEIDRVFDDFGFGRNWAGPRIGRSWLTRPWREESGDWQAWAPDVEVFHRNNELVVRADLPGLTKDDVTVDVTEDRITIHGERKREHEEEREGVYRSERSYGSFSRVIPLPQGAISDQAKANFKDGVLEITMPAPSEQVTRGRRLEISEGSEHKK